MADFKNDGETPVGMYNGWTAKTITSGQQAALKYFAATINGTNRSDLKEAHFSIVPNEKELEVFRKLAPSTTSTGNLRLNSGKKFDKLTAAELKTLDEYGKRAQSLNIAEGAAHNSAYAVASYSGIKETRSQSMQKISREALTNPVKPGEDLADYAKRLSVALDKQTSVKNYTPKQMSAMYTVSGAEREHLEKRIADSHDTKTHWSTRTKVHNVFAMKDAPENEAKFQAAAERAAKRLADAGIDAPATTKLWHGTSTYAGGRIAATGFKIPQPTTPTMPGACWIPGYTWLTSPVNRPCI